MSSAVAGNVVQPSEESEGPLGAGGGAAEDTTLFDGAGKDADSPSEGVGVVGLAGAAAIVVGAAGEAAVVAVPADDVAGLAGAAATVVEVAGEAAAVPVLAGDHAGLAGAAAT